MNIGRITAGLVVAGAVALGLPAAAQAAPGQISIVSAGSPSTNVGLLSVEFDSPTPVNSLTVELEAPGSTSAALTLMTSDFTFTPSGTTTTATVKTPITIGTGANELPSLGSYTILVTAGDTGKDTLPSTDAGTLEFIVYPTITLSISTQTPSFGESVTLSGTDMAVYPNGSSKPAPVTGQTIDFSFSQGLTTTTDSGTTDAGDFSVTLQAGIGDGLTLYKSPIDATTAATTTEAAATSNEVAVTVVSDPLEFTGLSRSPATVSYPAGVTITGVASYGTDGVWVALGDQGILVNAKGDYLSCRGCSGKTPGPWSAGTGFNGAFTVTVPGPIGSDTYTFGAGVLFEGTPWFTVTPASLKVPVEHVRTYDKGITAHIESSGKVSLRSCVAPDVEVVYAPDQAAYPKAKFQYASSKSGPWKTVPGASSVKAHLSAPKNLVGCYQATVSKPAGAVWFRLNMPASTAFKATTSVPGRAVR